MNSTIKAWIDELVTGVDDAQASEEFQEWLQDPEMDATANMTLSMDNPEMSAEEFLGVIYPSTVEMFEEEYSGEVDFLGYPKVPDEYL